MEPLLKDPVQPAHPHALPFRVIFEELRRRREAKLLEHASQLFLCTVQQAPIVLAGKIDAQENAYVALFEATQNIEENDDACTPLDVAIGNCQKADEPLKALLHRMDATAVCLSGGGIRCATISLGVLEGLARYSGEALPTEKPGTRLMQGLDYLSTVSGGGYMGSWMMSWVYRQMDTVGGSLRLQNALAAVDDALTLLAKQSADLDRVADLAQIAADNSANWLAEQKTVPLYGTLTAHQTRLQASLDQAIAGLDMLRDKQTTDRDQAALKIALSSAQGDLNAMLATIASRAYADVLSGLSGTAKRTGGDPDPQPIRHLRSYTSFLAPDLGLTLDTFTLAAIILRNFAVNWAMLLPIIFTAIAALELSAAMMTYLHLGAVDWLVRPFSRRFTVGGIIVLVLFVLSALAAGLALPSHRKKWFRVKFGREARLWLARLFIASVTLAVWLLTTTAAANAGTDVFLTKWIIASLGYATLTVFLALTYQRRTPSKQVRGVRPTWTLWVIGFAASITMAFAASGMLYELQTRLFPRLFVKFGLCDLPPVLMDDRLFVLFGLPLNLTVVALTTTLFCAVMGVFEGEDDREWWARCGGAFVGITLAWIVGHAVALYGNQVTVAEISAIAGSILGVGSSWLGFSSATAASKDAPKIGTLGGVGKFLLKHDLVLPVVGGAAILFLGLAMVWVEEHLRGALDGWRGFANRFPQGSPAHDIASAMTVLLTAAFLACLANVAININLFSLHGMYRMRLMRAFLGASNTFRHPDPFTQFDMKDTPREAEMPCFDGVPMHLLNATLNLTGTKNAAWRQRRAEGFSFSPVACGGWRVGYVPTPLYAGSHGKNHRQRGITVATAMAVSGAAANPNMGYQTSPVLSLLMTFFNLRLGCWLPNPARPEPKIPHFGKSGADFFTKTGPSFALRPLIAEALEQGDDTCRWVELTDGGHFEDLALYEMVVRRVKHIIVVDGGADPTFGFEDLGNAVRKIRIDLGIPIDFAAELKMKKGIKLKNRYCAVGKIRYSCVDRADGDTTTPDEALDGWVVYIKGCLTGEEPADILQYARTHAAFPHESTGDQFFTESQFESYRHLGSYAIDCITDGSTANQGTMQEFRSLAERYWAAN